MNKRFDKVNSAYRNDIMRVNIRQQMAHPMSEFLGTVMIVIVLWFGGILVLNNQAITGPTFIYYMVVLYSIIQPLKDFSKAGYNIPKGLASMERVDKILKAEVSIKEKETPFTSVRLSTTSSSGMLGSNMISSGCCAISTSLFPRERPWHSWDRAVAESRHWWTSFRAIMMCRRARCSSMAST